MDALVKHQTSEIRKAAPKIRLQGAEQFFINNATFIAAVAIAVLMILIAFILFQMEEANFVARAWVMHSREVKEHAETLLAEMGDAELSHGAYMMTGDGLILARYNELVSGLALDGGSPPAEIPPRSIAGELQTLGRLTADNPVQQKNLDNVTANLKKLFGYLAETLEATRAGKTKIGATAIDFEARESLMRPIHNGFTAMAEEENRLLALREHTEETGILRGNILIGICMTIYYLAVLLAIHLCQKAERRAQALMESALRESEERYSLAIQGLSVGLWDWNIPTGDIYWSPRFREIVGIAGTDIKPSLDFVEKNVHPDDRESVMKQLNVYLLNQEAPIYQNECRFRHADGSYVWLYSRGQAICGKDGKAIRLVGCIEDITARKEIERDIERHMDALKRSNQELDDFAYIASHDLKEPLRGLVNNAMFLKEDFSGKLEDSTVRHLDRMTFLCQRMEKLIDNLLYFSRLGRQEMAIQSTDLNEVIKDIRAMMESTLQQANAVIVTPEPLPTITCDLPRITEVFRNLITNAVKYNKSAEKRIEIGCADLEKLAGGNGKKGSAFYVRDNGIGIPEQFYNDIFRIFKRLNDEDDSTKGTGVGLTFVRKIVERHGGRVWPESKVGAGTTFYFTLNPGKEAQ